MTNLSNHYTCFLGSRHLASGQLQEVALAVKRALEAGTDEPILIINDTTGRPLDLDTTGSDDEVLARLVHPATADAEPSRADRPAGDATRGPGRPKLGVVAREVTLLPRHWEWLATQPSGASTTLRRLVELASRDDGHQERVRKSQERAYYFMSAIAGDLPGFEEATRALYANDQTGFKQRIADWPIDVANHAIWLAFGEGPSP